MTRGFDCLRQGLDWTRPFSFGQTDQSLRLFHIMLQAGLSLATIKLAAILLFLLLTSPTATNALASAALLAGTKPDAALPDEESKR